MTYKEFINAVFNFCEEGLYSLAHLIGVSYEELNVFIFILLILHNLTSYFCIMFLSHRLSNYQTEVKQQEDLDFP
jgi:hypothetical protein